ncbi:MAG: hypothetical protein ACXABY_18400, partial [Candidatus Thorarchaeota archaeon]
MTDQAVSPWTQFLTEAKGDCDEAVLKIAGKKTKLSVADATRVVELWITKSLGYEMDRYGAYVAPDGKTRIKLTKRNIQSFTGGKGKWYKTDSKALTQHGIAIVYGARKRAGQDDLVKKTLDVHKKKRAKAKSKKESKKNNTKALRIAMGLLSSQMTPLQRKAAIRAKNTEALERKAEALIPEIVAHSLSGDPDKHLSTSEPPVFVDPRRRASSKAPFPEEHVWKDASSGKPIKVWKHGNSIGIKVGKMPINPFSHTMDFTFRSGSSTGIVGGIQDGKLPFLFMIISAESKQGTGTKMLRSFCKLLSAYGFNNF